MKLYTEEQVKKILEELQKAFLPENTECDGAHCMGCWKDVLRTTMQMVNLFNPITLPSDEEIEEYDDGSTKLNPRTYYDAFQDGAKWMRDKIQNK